MMTFIDSLLMEGLLDKLHGVLKKCLASCYRVTIAYKSMNWTISVVMNCTMNLKKLLLTKKDIDIWKGPDTFYRTNQ